MSERPRPQSELQQREELHVSDKLFDIAAQIAIKRKKKHPLKIGEIVCDLESGMYRLDSLSGRTALVTAVDPETQEEVTISCERKNLFSADVFWGTLAELASNRSNLPAVEDALKPIGVKNKTTPKNR